MADLDKRAEGKTFSGGADGSLSSEFMGAISRIGYGRTPDEPNSALSAIIETEIIPRLMLAHKAKVLTRAPLTSRVGISADDIDAFCETVRFRRIEDVHAFIADTCARGVEAESILLDLLAPTARRLGEMWERDESDFATVTISLCRLQQVLRRVSGAHGRGPAPSEPAHRALLAPAPGEQHNFGVLMVDEFLHRAGWDVWTTPCVTADEVERMVSREIFEIAGLSLSCEAFLPQLESLIASIRKRSRNREIAVMVGGRVFLERPELVAMIGADACAVDGRDAVIQAEKLLPAKAARLETPK